MKVALLERVSYSGISRLFVAESRCMETGELLTRGYSDFSQEAADFQCATLVSGLRTKVWVSDETRAIEGIPQYGVAA